MKTLTEIVETDPQQRTPQERTYLDYRRRGAWMEALSLFRDLNNLTFRHWMLSDALERRSLEDLMRLAHDESRSDPGLRVVEYVWSRSGLQEVFAPEIRSMKQQHEDPQTDLSE